MLISAWSSAMQSSARAWGLVGSSTATSSFSANACLLSDKDLAALLGMAEDQAQDGAVRRVGDRQADDLDLGPLERADDLQQLADPVLEENRELGHGWPVPAMQGFQLDFAAAVILAETHEAPVFPGLDGVRSRTS